MFSGPAAVMHSALDRVRPTLVAGGDTDYFAFHEHRFERQLATLTRLLPGGARVLDVGSHYLHMASALQASGAVVTAIDIPEFQRLDFVMRRAQLSGVRCVTDGDLGRGDFLRDERDEYDAVVFCEILEHVTFNPVRFWRRVYDLLRPGGCVYLTTPNSLRLTNVLKTLARLLVRRGVGIPVNEILGYVTYGHHWKEYSAAELREYFAILSPDFVTEIRYADFFVGERAVGRLVARAAGVVPGLRPHLEAVVRVPTKTEWRAEEKTSYAE